MSFPLSVYLYILVVYLKRFGTTCMPTASGIRSGHACGSYRSSIASRQIPVPSRLLTRFLAHVCGILSGNKCRCDYLCACLSGRCLKSLEGAVSPQCHGESLLSTFNTFKYMYFIQAL